MDAVRSQNRLAARAPENEAESDKRARRADRGLSDDTSLSYAACTGISQHIQALRHFIRAQAGQRQPVLLLGERGLKQKQIAQAIHQCGEKYNEPFIAVSTHLLQPAAVHALLFGPGGILRHNQAGTVFLAGTAELLSLLQRQLTLMLGDEYGWAEPGIHPRLILAITEPDVIRRMEAPLLLAIRDALHSSTLSLLPLRERREDIPVLISHLTARLAVRLQRGTCQVTTTAITRLTEYDWPRNIDELEAVLESIISHLPPQRIESHLLPEPVCQSSLLSLLTIRQDYQQTVSVFEQRLIEAALRQADGVQVRAADLLGLRVQTLNAKIKRSRELLNLAKSLREAR